MMADSGQRTMDEEGERYVNASEVPATYIRPGVDTLIYRLTEALQEVTVPRAYAPSIASYDGIHPAENLFRQLQLRLDTKLYEEAQRTLEDLFPDKTDTTYAKFFASKSQHYNSLEEYFRTKQRYEETSPHNHHVAQTTLHGWKDPTTIPHDHHHGHKTTQQCHLPPANSAKDNTGTLSASNDQLLTPITAKPTTPATTAKAPSTKTTMAVRRHCLLRQPPRRQATLAPNRWSLRLSAYDYEIRYIKGQFETDGEHVGGSTCDFLFAGGNLTKGKFFSPNYPSPYPRDVRCTYRFLGKATDRISVVFESLSLQRGDNS
ncbi:hypothetical protein LAZ67_5002450 [Cordylochernes scorpioides]|uniref:CUB domain-containing protein n=1 Tax=Cordylochernes scorpioides TaxID=51811 RepID=A0ABY6KHG0_9ARAC|nr:hypothetical protein LAZ67_5002450 [Cordylochernes scorpioides]